MANFKKRVSEIKTDAPSLLALLKTNKAKPRAKEAGLCFTRKADPSNPKASDGRPFFIVENASGELYLGVSDKVIAALGVANHEISLSMVLNEFPIYAIPRKSYVRDAQGVVVTNPNGTPALQIVENEYNYAIGVKQGAGDSHVFSIEELEEMAKSGEEDLGISQDFQDEKELGKKK